MPRGKLYVDGQDVTAGPPTQSPRETALQILLRRDSAKEVPTPIVGSSSSVQDSQPGQVQLSPATEGTFNAYNPGTLGKVKWWLERNVDKIPVVNFFHTIHEQAERAKKETLIELAEGGDAKKAAVVGTAYGILVDAFVDMPGTAYETVKSVWSKASSKPIDMGPLGLRHETTQKSEVITENPDAEVENELMLARAAPQTYRAEQKLKEAKQLEPEIIKLNEQAEQLKEQAKWFEENRKKAETDPAFARLYNAEAVVYNRQVQEFNAKVAAIQARLEALGVDEANAQVENFNKNLEKVHKGFAIGEVAGSIVGSTVLANAAPSTLQAVAPEKVVRVESDKIPEVFGGEAGTRVTVKETVYKGWLRKSPIETHYQTVLSTGDDIRFTKSFVSDTEGAALKIAGSDTREFLLTKFKSTKPFETGEVIKPSAPIGPDEFEKITGKPWPTGVVKKELETQTILRTTSGEEVSIIENAIIGKTTFQKTQLKPEFSLSAKEPVLSPEDFALLQKITNAKSSGERTGS
ncbi:hypothetical protein, partial [Thermococcus sp.]|uniref:hypothetical protein n=1 Tax=Thermococcus sp. TaxID=35749 RepID=UPI00261D8A84